MKKKILDFEGKVPELKVVDRETGKDYIGCEVLKKVINSPPENSNRFVVCECVGKHDLHGVMIFRGDILRLKYGKSVLYGIVEYDTNSARYLIHLSDGRYAVFGHHTDEFEWIEVIDHAAKINIENYKLENDFNNGK